VMGAAWLGYLAYRYFRQPMRPWVRWTCLGLKALAAILLLMMLLEPTWVTESAKPGANDFLLLVDNGEGMQIQKGRETIDALMNARETTGSWLHKLHEMFRVENFTFDSRLRKITGPAEADLKGARSDLGGALENLGQRYARRPLAGILLVTDGNATDLDKLAKLTPSVPIFPVLAGKEDAAVSDLSLHHLDVTASSFEDAPVTILASLSAQGLAGQKAILTVTDEKNAEIHKEAFEIKGADETLPVRIRFRPATPGLSFYQIAVKPEAANVTEVTTRNNTQKLAIDRGEGPYRILYVSGRPNWDYKFMRRALEPDAETQLIGLIRVAKREPKFAWRGRQGESGNPLFRGFAGNLPEEEETYDKPVLIRLNTRDATELRDGFPKERDTLFKDYDCIVIDDLEAKFFTEDQHQLIEKFVSVRGGSLLMLGGQESMQWGDYAKTPVGQMLPVYLDTFAKGEPSTDARMTMSREGWLEPWARLRLTEQEEEVRLAHMPPFKSINQLKAIKPGASALATVVDEQKREFPALVTHRFGEGRVAVVTIADLWRWGLKQDYLHEDLDKWWRQLARWLVADVPDFIQVTTAWDEDTGLAKRKISVRVRNQAYRPEENATVELQVHAPNATADAPPQKIFAEPSLDEPGLFTAEVVCSEPGAFRVTAAVNDSTGAKIGAAHTGWTWNPALDEFASLRPNRALLADLAAKSGGKMVAADELDGFVKDLDKLDTPITETSSLPLWHQSWLFVLVVLLFAAEWGLRRWQGLV